MSENLVPMVVMTGMFAMIFGIVYIRSRENMAMIEKGLNPRTKDVRPQPFVNLKWGLLLLGCGCGLLLAYIIDYNVLGNNKRSMARTSISIGGHHSRAKNNAITIADTGHTINDTSLAAKNIGAKNNDADDDEDSHSIAEIRGTDNDNPAIYFALIAIGGGLGLFFSYRIEKKEWLDKRVAL